MRNLEAELGTALFERHARHVVLTGEGALFAKTVGESLSSLEIGAGRLRRGFVRSTVVLDIESDLAVSWLMPLLTEDVQDALNVHLDVRIRPDPPRLVLGDADLAVSWGAVQCTGFRTERFLDPIVFPVASPSLLGTGGKLVDPGIFTNNRLIHERGLYWWRRSFEILGLSLDDAAGHLFFNRSYLCIDAAVRGLGIAMGDDAICAAHLASGALVRLPQPEMPSRDGYYMLVPDRTQLPRPVQRVRDWLVAIAR